MWYTLWCRRAAPQHKVIIRTLLGAHLSTEVQWLIERQDLITDDENDQSDTVSIREHGSVSLCRDGQRRQLDLVAGVAPTIQWHQDWSKTLLK